MLPSLFSPHMLPLANFGSFFGVDGLVVLVVGLLIFGRRLPEVGKNVGKTIVEFKKGLSGNYSSEEEKPQETEDRPVKRLSSGSRVSVNENLDARPASRTTKRLPETEEV